jgi:hypothetical protein
MRKLSFCHAISLLASCLLLVAPLRAQEKDQPAAKAKSQRPTVGNRLTIEVTGGEKNVPVENASVYVKFVEERKIRKDKKYELNVKTNREGITHIPDAPEGKVLIQIIAEGWKTFGRWYEITGPQQTIQIHLEKPPRWY